MHKQQTHNFFLDNQTNDDHKVYRTFQDQLFLHKIIDSPKVYKVLFSNNLLNKESIYKSIFSYILCALFASLVYYFTNNNAFAGSEYGEFTNEPSFYFAFFSALSLVIFLFLIRDIKKFFKNRYKTKIVQQSQEILSTQIININLFSYYAFIKNLNHFDMIHQWQDLIYYTLKKHPNIDINEYLYKLAYAPSKDYKEVDERLNKIEKRIKNQA